MNENNQHQFAVVRKDNSFFLKKRIDVDPNQECPIFVSSYKEARKFWSRMNKNNNYINLICIKSESIDLVVGKTYESIKDFEDSGLIKVKDESKEFYLYPKEWFQNEDLLRI